MPWAPPGVPVVAAPEASVGVYRLPPMVLKPAGFWKLASWIWPATCAVVWFGWV